MYRLQAGSSRESWAVKLSHRLGQDHDDNDDNDINDKGNDDADNEDKDNEGDDNYGKDNDDDDELIGYFIPTHL